MTKNPQIKVLQHQPYSNLRRGIFLLTIILRNWRNTRLSKHKKPKSSRNLKTSNSKLTISATKRRPCQWRRRIFPWVSQLALNRISKRSSKMRKPGVLPTSTWTNIRNSQKCTKENRNSQIQTHLNQNNRKTTILMTRKMKANG